MRVLLTGARGFIGSAILARLLDIGAEVVAVRRPGGATPPERSGVRWIAVDIGRAGDPDNWRPHLAGVDAVVNAAGVLQDSGGDTTEGVHRAGPAALFEACHRAGVRRVIQISALGADNPRTPFSHSKAAGDAILTGLDLDWVILRPSVVLGRGAAGSGALLRGLAALPVLPVMPDTGPLQPVALDDLVETVARLLQPGAPACLVLDVVGPETFTMTELVAVFRRWLGLAPSRAVALPPAAAGLAYRLGDGLRALGWRSTLSTTARLEIARGATGDPRGWRTATGLAPRTIETALAAAPATTADQWFARLYFLVPVTLAVFALFWIATGIVSLGPGYGIGVDLMLRGGAGALAGPLVIAGAIADLAIGLAIAWRPTARLGLWAAVAITVFYAVAGTIILPELWAEPLGPLLKIWPILMLNLVLLATVARR